MILNTQFILNEIKTEKVKKLNPLQERDQKISLEEQEKEQKIQQQVAMIFKDKAYYKPFQEAAIQSNVIPNETPEERAKRLADDRKERLASKQMAHQTAQVLGRSAVYGATNTLLGHGLNLAGKGITHGVNAVKQWMA
jgi:hypothetical protein